MLVIDVHIGSRDSEGEDIPKNAWKELRCRKLGGNRVGRG